MTYLFRYKDIEKRRNAEVFSNMKTQFFPNILDNLREVFQKLQKEESTKIRYKDLLEKELSVTLLLEFKLRFDNQGNLLSKLQEKLTSYDYKINLLEKTSQSKKLKSEIATMNTELKEDITTLSVEIEKLTKLERIPSRIPGLLRSETKR